MLFYFVMMFVSFLLKLAPFLLHYVDVEFMNMSLWLFMFVFHSMDFRIEQSSPRKVERDKERSLLFLSPFSCSFFSCFGRVYVLSLCSLVLFISLPGTLNLYLFSSPSLTLWNQMSHLFILSQIWVWWPLFCLWSACECVWLSVIIFPLKVWCLKAEECFFFNSTYINTCTGRSK